MKRSVNMWWMLAVILSAAVLAYDLYLLGQYREYNQALQQDRLDEIVTNAYAYSNLVNAYQLQQDRQFEASLEAYTGLIEQTRGEVRQLIEYNLATLYLQRAIELLRGDDRELAIPLIELAKVSYREILHNTSDNWNAKYNLEIALRILPDVEQTEPEEDILPERSPEAIGTLQSRDLLP